MRQALLAAVALFPGFVWATIAKYVAILLGYPVASETDWSASDIALSVGAVTTLITLFALLLFTANEN